MVWKTSRGGGGRGQILPSFTAIFSICPKRKGKLREIPILSRIWSRKVDMIMFVGRIKKVKDNLITFISQFASHTVQVGFV